MNSTIDSRNTTAPAARPAVVLGLHILVMLVYSLLFANVFWLMPLLVRLYFGSDNLDTRDWQTTLVTAAVPTFMMGSIFWAELLRRVRLRTYLAIFWLTAALPLACVALAQNYGQFLACHLIAAAGTASWNPLFGRLLKHFYSDAIRGRAYALLNAIGLGGSVAAIYAVGKWVEAHPDAFRIFFPAAAGLQLLGMAVLLWLSRMTKADAKPRETAVGSWKIPLDAVLHMGRVLRADRTFLRYEIAFMTYGIAFMFCDALLPVLATAKLGMRYEDYAHSTQMVEKIARLTLTLPMGLLLDRIGPVRTSGLGFAILGLYPVALLLAGSPTGIAFASIFYGAGLAAVTMGWMLGPVALAGSPDKVPQYVAIHATLVGVRGVLFQGFGMLLYKTSGTFLLPLGLGAMLFVAAALQMRALAVRLRGVTTAGTRAAG